MRGKGERARRVRNGEREDGKLAQEEEGQEKGGKGKEGKKGEEEEQELKGVEAGSTNVL